MDVLLDDGVIYLVYGLMIAAIIILLVLAYRKMQADNARAAEEDRDDPNKLTSKKSGAATAKSRFAQLGDD